MELPRLAAPLLLALGLWTTGAVAQPQAPRPAAREFQAPRQPTAEELEAEKARARSNNLQTYTQDVPVEVSPIPWMAIGLIVLIFAVATPFAIRAYKTTADEIAPAFKAAGGGARRRGPEDDV